MLSNEFVKTAIRAAHIAGDILIEHVTSDNVLVVSNKGENDIETEADIQSGEEIKKIILDSFPNHSVSFEEKSLDISNESEYSWVVDSITGTIHFDGKLPYFGLDIALLKDSIPILGLHYRPYSGDAFVAYKGSGAFHINNRFGLEKKMEVSKIRESKDGIILVDSGKSMSEREQTSKIIQRLIPHFRQLDKFSDGSQAGLLGTSKVVGYVCNTNNYWDLVAQKVIVEESGGKATTFKGEDLSVESKTVVYSNGILHSYILSLIHEV